MTCVCPMLMTLSKDIRRQAIFVCHSLGGLVVKQALVLQNLTAALRAIQQCASGIIFLGTPHRGSNLGKILGRAAFVTGASRNLSELLSTDSGPLSELNSDFKIYYMRRREERFPLRIRSFHEMLWTRTPIPFLRLEVVPPDSGRSDLEGDDATPIYKDHHAICRFDSPQDPLFQDIWKQLDKWMAYSGMDRLTRVPSSSDDEGFKRSKEKIRLYFMSDLS